MISFLYRSIYIFVKLTSPNQLNFDSVNTYTPVYSPPGRHSALFHFGRQFPNPTCIFHARRERELSPTIAKLLTAHNICLSSKRHPFDLSRVKFFSFTLLHGGLLRFARPQTSRSLQIRDVRENKADHARSVVL